MTLLKVLLDATKAARDYVANNLEMATDHTGEKNRYGDQTLVLDAKAEDEIIRILNESGISFNFLTEERGFVTSTSLPDYLAIIDPIDGSSNIERSIPLCTAGVSIVPFSENMTTDDIDISVIDSLFTKETYVAIKGKGVTRNGRDVRVSKPIDIKDAIISYDTNRPWNREFTNSSIRVLDAVKDIRRTASNLLDLCWTASGALDAMIDMRGKLPIVHVCGTHMVFEAGGHVIDMAGNRLCLPLEIDTRMNFIAASGKELASSLYRIFKGI
ncbi:inositol monophosphatase [Candidatus Thorarchaeota archaeon]|nr:MAG: inositol monophosphatase [Candidatus Thorarchaeota archaeon]